jgi:hypothetical protein
LRIEATAQVLPDQTVVCLVTGTVEVSAVHRRLPQAIDPTLDALRKSIEEDPGVL